MEILVAPIHGTPFCNGTPPGIVAVNAAGLQQLASSVIVTGTNACAEFVDASKPQLRLTNSTAHADFTLSAGGVATIRPTGGELHLLTVGRYASWIGLTCNGSEAAPTPILDDNVISDLSCYAHDGTTYSGGGAIRIYANENQGPNNHGSRIQFFTTQNGTSNAWWQEIPGMSIWDNGFVGFGTGLFGAPARQCESVDPTNPQLRLTHTAATHYVDCRVDSSGILTLTPSGAVVAFAGYLRHNVAPPYGTAGTPSDEAGYLSYYAPTSNYCGIYFHNEFLTNYRHYFSFKTTDGANVLAERLRITDNASGGSIARLSGTAATTDTELCNVDFVNLHNGYTVGRLSSGTGTSDHDLGYVAIGVNVVGNPGITFERMRVESNAHVSINTVAADRYAYLNISDAIEGTTPSLTAQAAAHLALINRYLTHLVFCVDDASNIASILHRHASLDGYAYPIVLQPLGGNLGIGTGATTGPAKKLEVCTTSGEQLRLTHTAASKYTDFGVDSSGNVTITPTGTTATIAAGTLQFTGHIAQDAIVSNAPTSSPHTIDWTAGNSQLLDETGLSGNLTVVFTAPAGPTELRLKVLQDTAVREITWPASVKWDDANPWVAATMPAVNKYRIVRFYFDGTHYHGDFSGDRTP